MDGDAGYDRLMEGRLTKVETQVDSLIAWRNWVLGAMTVIGFVAGVYAKVLGGVLRTMFS